MVDDGEVEHRDSAGNAGSIGPGDVQWRTAGADVQAGGGELLVLDRAGDGVALEVRAPSRLLVLGGGLLAGLGRMVFVVLTAAPLLATALLSTVGKVR